MKLFSALFYFAKSPLKGFFVFSFVLSISGCWWSSSKVAAKPVVQVNNKSLDVKDFSELLASKLKNFDALAAKDPNNVKRAKEEIIRNFILQSLISDFAAENNISIADDELEKEINSIRSSYPDDLSFRRVLAEENIAFSDWKDSLRQTLLDKKVFAKVSSGIKKPSTDEVKKYYNEKKDRYKKKERVYLRQIVTDDLTKAQSIRDEIKKFDFADLAKKFSVSPEGKAGGLVGWVERGSVDIFDKAFQLPIGGISPVLESSYGFHIFKVERKAAPGYASVEEVKDEIESALTGNKEQAEFLRWLDAQIRNARVLRDNALIDAISVETRGQ